MQQYLPLPDGSDFKVPEGMAYEEALVLARKKYPDAFPIDKSNAKQGFVPSFMQGMRGIGQGAGMLGGVAAGVSDDALKAAHKRTQREEQEKVKSLSMRDVEKAYADEGAMSGLGSLMTLWKENIAQSLPSMGAIGAGARAGAMAGAALPLPPQGKLVAGAVGGLGGGLMGALPSQAGSMIGRQIDENPNAPIDRTAAMAATAGAGALDLASQFLVLGKLGLGPQVTGAVSGLLKRGASESAEQVLLREAQRSYGSAAGRGAVRGVVAEVPIEVAQQVIERAQAGMPLLTPDAIQEYKDTAITMVGPGVALGSVGGVHGRMQAGQQAEEMATAKAAATAQAAQATENARLAQENLLQGPQLPPTALEAGTPHAPVATPPNPEDVQKEIEALPRQQAVLEREAQRLKEAASVEQDPEKAAELADQHLRYNDALQSMKARMGELEKTGVSFTPAETQFAQQEALVNKLKKQRAKAQEQGDTSKIKAIGAAEAAATKKLEELRQSLPDTQRQPDLFAEADRVDATAAKYDIDQQLDAEQQAKQDKARRASVKGWASQYMSIEEQRVADAEEAAAEEAAFSERVAATESEITAPVYNKEASVPQEIGDVVDGRVVAQTPAGGKVSYPAGAAPTDGEAPTGKLAPTRYGRLLQHVDEGRITPELNKAMGLGLAEEADLNTQQGAVAALPALDRRAREAKQFLESTDPDKLQGRAFKNAVGADSLLREIRKLQDRANQTLREQGDIPLERRPTATGIDTNKTPAQLKREADEAKGEAESHLLDFEALVDDLRKGVYLGGANPAGASSTADGLRKKGRDVLKQYEEAFIREIELRRAIEKKPALSDGQASAAVSTIERGFADKSLSGRGAYLSKFKGMTRLLDEATNYDAKVAHDLAQLRALYDRLDKAKGAQGVDEAAAGLRRWYESEEHEWWRPEYKTLAAQVKQVLADRVKTSQSQNAAALRKAIAEKEEMLGRRTRVANVAGFDKGSPDGSYYAKRLDSLEKALAAAVENGASQSVLNGIQRKMRFIRERDIRVGVDPVEASGWHRALGELRRRLLLTPRDLTINKEAPDFGTGMRKPLELTAQTNASMEREEAKVDETRPFFGGPRARAFDAANRVLAMADLNPQLAGLLTQARDILEQEQGSPALAALVSAQAERIQKGIDKPFLSRDPNVRGENRKQRDLPLMGALKELLRREVAARTDNTKQRELFDGANTDLGVASEETQARATAAEERFARSFPNAVVEGLPQRVKEVMQRHYFRKALDSKRINAQRTAEEASKKATLAAAQAVVKAQGEAPVSLKKALQRQVAPQKERIASLEDERRQLLEDAKTLRESGQQYAISGGKHKGNLQKAEIAQRVAAAKAKAKTLRVELRRLVKGRPEEGDTSIGLAGAREAFTQEIAEVNESIAAEEEFIKRATTQMQYRTGANDSADFAAALRELNDALNKSDKQLAFEREYLRSLEQGLRPIAAEEAAALRVKEQAEGPNADAAARMEEQATLEAPRTQRTVETAERQNVKTGERVVLMTSSGVNDERIAVLRKQLAAAKKAGRAPQVEALQAAITDLRQKNMVPVTRPSTRDIAKETAEETRDRIKQENAERAQQRADRLAARGVNRKSAKENAESAREAMETLRRRGDAPPRKPIPKGLKTKPPGFETSYTDRELADLRAMGVIGETSTKPGLESWGVEDNGIDYVPDDGGVLHLRESPNATTTVDAGEAKQYAAHVIANAPKGVKIVYAPTAAEIPENFARAIKRLGKTNSDVSGMVLPTGEVLIVGDSHANLDEMARTVAHELLGHYGPDVILGKEGFAALSKAIWQDGEAGVRKIADALGVGEQIDAILQGDAALQKWLAANPELKIEHAPDALKLAVSRELVADTATYNLPTKPDSLVQAFIKKIVSALRKYAPWLNTKATTQEIFDLLRSSMSAFHNKNIGPYRSPAEVGATRTASVSQAMPGFGGGPDAVVGRPSIKDQIPQWRSSGMLATVVAGFDSAAGLETALQRGAKLDGGTRADLKWMQPMFWVRAYSDLFHHTTDFMMYGGKGIVREDVGGGKYTETYGVKDGKRTGPGLPYVIEALKGVSKDPNVAEKMATFYGLSQRAARVGWDTVASDINGDATKKAEMEAQNAEFKKGLAANPAVHAALKEWFQRYQQYNHALLDFLAETQAMPREKVKELKSYGDYIPMYRIHGNSVERLSENGGWQREGDITHQPYLAELTGGDEKVMGFFASSVRNTHIIIDKALRNQAARNAAFTMRELGLLEKGTSIANGSGSMSDPNVLRFNVEPIPGRAGDTGERHIVVNTESVGVPPALVMHGLRGVATQTPTALKLLSIPARIVRKMVMANPMYVVRQMYSDVPSMLFTSGADANVSKIFGEMASVFRGMGGAKEDATVARLQPAGLLGGNLYTGTTEDLERVSRRLAGHNAGKMSFNGLMTALDAMAFRADAFSRKHVYDSLRSKGMSEMEAMLATRDAIDFSRRGTSSSLRMLTSIVPFMNSQMQSLYAVGRAMTGKMPFEQRLQLKQKFFQRGMMLMAGSLAYAMAMEDDDAYKNAAPGQRYHYWFIRVPGLDEPLRMRIPFEAGFMFKAVPEAVYQYLTDGVTGKEMAKGIGTAAMNINPFAIPPAIKFAIEQGLNVNTFTGQDLEDKRMQQVAPHLRYRAQTTEAAKELGKLTGLSPVRLEHAVSAFTTATGVSILSAMDPLVRSAQGPDAAGRVEGRNSTMPIFGSAFQPNDATGVVNNAYEIAKEAHMHAQTVKRLSEAGRGAEAIAYAKQFEKQVAFGQDKGPVSAYEKRMNDLRKQERQIQEAPERAISPERKRELLDKLRRVQIRESDNFRTASVRAGI